MTNDTLTMDTRDIMRRINLRVRFGRGHRARIWLAARLVALAGIVAGCATSIEFD